MRTAGELKGATIEAMDGDIGSVQDVYFDDRTWTVRYVVVDTGAWLPGRQVLISPFAFQAVPGASRLRTSLTKKQIENSPSPDSDRPVNRQREVEFSRYYGYPYYWVGPYRWGGLAYPGLPLEAPQPSPVDEEMLARDLEGGDPNLRSARDVMGYYINATDGDIGHVEDFLVDDETWAILHHRRHAELAARPACAGLAGVDQGSELAGLQGLRGSLEAPHRGRPRVRSEHAAGPRARGAPLRLPRAFEVLGTRAEKKGLVKHHGKTRGR